MEGEEDVAGEQDAEKACAKEEVVEVLRLEIAMIEASRKQPLLPK